MGKMIDALKLLEEKSPRPPKGSSGVGAALILEQPPSPSPQAEAPCAAEPPIAASKAESPMPVETPTQLHDSHPSLALRLRVFSAPDVNRAQDEPAEGRPTNGSTTAIVRWLKSSHEAASCETADELAAIADRILAQSAPGGPGTLVFASVGSDGASAPLVAGLACAIASRQEGRVLAIDADAVDAALSRRLGVAGESGLIDVARGEVDWTELVRETDVERLDFMPARFAQDGPSSRCDGLDAGRALAEMGMHYAMTLIDAGPAEQLDAVRLGRYCDGVCLVVRLGETSKAAVEQAARALRLAKAYLVGTIAVN